MYKVDQVYRLGLRCPVTTIPGRPFIVTRKGEPVAELRPVTPEFLQATAHLKSVSGPS